LRYFPLWRTWFSLCGLCKLPWNDIQPLSQADYPLKDPKTGELVRAKIPDHVENYVKYYSAVTGHQSTSKDLIKMSERVYTFQRIFNIRLGKGLRKHDSNLPYRAVGPVTPLEYESRVERYDTQLKELGLKFNGKSTEEKITILRKHREEQYTKLQDAVYLERGWNNNGCPTIEMVRKLGIDFDEVIDVISPYQ